MYQRPSAPRSIGGVFDDAIRLYRESFRAAWVLALITQVAVAIPSFWWESRVKGLSVVAQQQEVFVALQSSTLWLLILITIPLYLVFYNAVLASVNGVATGRELSTNQALGVGARVLPRAFGLGFLVFLIVIVGVVLLVVPGIYWAGTLQLSFVALVVEDLGIGASMAASSRLIKGHWWRSGTLYSIAIGIALVLSLVVGIVGAVLAALSGPGSAVASIASQLLGLVAGTVLAPLYPAVLLAMYYDLKLRKEGADLAGRVTKLPGDQ